MPIIIPKSDKRLLCNPLHLMAITLTSRPIGALLSGIIVVVNILHIHAFFIAYEFIDLVVSGVWKIEIEKQAKYMYKINKIYKIT